jgi:hypothetical protein
MLALRISTTLPGAEASIFGSETTILLTLMPALSTGPDSAPTLLLGTFSLLDYGNGDSLTCGNIVGHRSSDRTGIPFSSQKLVLNIQRTTSRTTSTVGSESHSVTVPFTPSGLRGQSLFLSRVLFENQGRRLRIYHRGRTCVQGEMDVAAQRGNHAGLPQHPFANPPRWEKKKV